MQTEASSSPSRIGDIPANLKPGLRQYDSETSGSGLLAFIQHGIPALPPRATKLDNFRSPIPPDLPEHPAGVWIKKKQDDGSIKTSLVKGFRINGYTTPEQIKDLLLYLYDEKLLQSPLSTEQKNDPNLQRILTSLIQKHFLHNKESQTKINCSRHPYIIAFLLHQTLTEGCKENNFTEKYLLTKLSQKDSEFTAHTPLPDGRTDQLKVWKDILILIPQMKDLINKFRPTKTGQNKNQRINQAEVLSRAAKKPAAEKGFIESFIEKIPVDEIIEPLQLMMVLLGDLNISLNITDANLRRINQYIGTEAIVDYLKSNQVDATSEGAFQLREIIIQSADNSNEMETQLNQLQPVSTNIVNELLNGNYKNLSLISEKLLPSIHLLQNIYKSSIRSGLFTVAISALHTPFMSPFKYIPEKFITAFIIHFMIKSKPDTWSAISENFNLFLEKIIAPALSEDNYYLNPSNYTSKNLIDYGVKTTAMNKVKTISTLIKVMNEIEVSLNTLMSTQAVFALPMQHVTGIMELFQYIMEKLQNNQLT